jgi:hypothetical protein
MQTQLIVPFEDLRYLSITCGNCLAEVTIDLADTTHNPNPNQCPVCLQEFDQASVREHVHSVTMAFRQITKTKHRFSFRIRKSLTATTPANPEL